jgi:hypothetical protein
VNSFAYNCVYVCACIYCILILVYTTVRFIDAELLFIYKERNLWTLLSHFQTVLFNVSSVIQLNLVLIYISSKAKIDPLKN